MTYRLILNFFDPLLTSDGQPYHRARYKAIIQEQIMLGYLSKGGVTYGDTEEMTPHERQIAMDTIKEILETQKKQQEEAIANSQQAQEPKTLLNR